MDVPNEDRIPESVKPRERGGEEREGEREEEEYTLVYWDCKGIGEPIRYLFAIAGKPFKDVRIPININNGFKQHLPIEWQQRIPYGKLPFLEIGKQSENRNLVSSKPICRYLASEFGLTAEDPLDEAKCDEYMDTLRDYMDMWRPVYFIQDERKMAEVKNKILEIHTPKYFGAYDRIVAENNGRNLVGCKLTWADVYLTHCIDHLQSVFQLNLLTPYPALTQLYNHVLNLPQIQQWVQQRPQTPF